MAVHKLQSENPSNPATQESVAKTITQQTIVCNKCKKKGHVAKVCRSANPYSGQQSKEKAVRRPQGR